MPRLLVLCLRRRRSLIRQGRLLVHSDPGRRLQRVSAVDVAVGLLVVFMTFLAPCGHALGPAHRLRRE